MKYSITQESFNVWILEWEDGTNSRHRSRLAAERMAEEFINRKKLKNKMKNIELYKITGAIAIASLIVTIACVYVVIWIPEHLLLMKVLTTSLMTFVLSFAATGFLIE